MKKSLKILILEDVPSDAKLIRLELRKTNKEFESIVIQDEENFLKELKTFQPDLILSDYSMPQFTGLDALEIAKKKCPEIPFIIVTGTINEETAIKCMRWGAWDYVLKDNLVHLGHAVKNAIQLRADNEKKKLAEEALQESEAKFHSLFSEMAEGAYLHEIIYNKKGKAVNYRIIETNPASEKHLNIKSENAVGKLATELYGTKEAPFLEIYAKVVKTGIPVKFEEYFPQMKKYFQISVYSPEKGKFATLFSNITERKKAEKALQESETRYKNLYSMIRLMSDNLPDLVWTKDIEGNFLFVNKACSEILLNAKDTDEPIGKNDMYFASREIESHPDNPDYHTFGETCVSSDLAVLTNKKSQRFDEFGNVKGEFIFLDIYKAPFEDEKGNLIGTVGCARIVTKERQMEKELQESEEKFRLLAENSIDAVWKMDLKMVFTYISPSVKNIMGYTVEEWVGTRLSRHTSTKEFFNMARKALSAIKNYKKSKHLTFETVMLNKDGTEILVEINTKLLFNKKGLPIGIQGTTRDITKRKKAEDILQQHTQLLETLQHTTAALSTSLKLDDVLQIILDQISQAIPFDSASIFLIVGEKLKPVIVNGVNPDLIDQTYPMDNPLFQEIRSTRKPLLISNAMSDSRFKGWGETTNICSWIGIPLITREGLIGFLTLDSYKANVYTSDQITLAQPFAAQAAQAIHNARLYQRVIENANELEIFNKMAVGRELKMIELKKEINSLLEKAGKEPVYKIIE